MLACLAGRKPPAARQGGGTLVPETGIHQLCNSACPRVAHRGHDELVNVPEGGAPDVTARTRQHWRHVKPERLSVYCGGSGLRG